MDYTILDILEPFEDEALYSWIARMVNCYSNGSNPKKIRNHLEYLFGPETTDYPGLYMQLGLDYFVDHANMPHSPFFGSEEKMFNIMTVFPFYFSFLNDSQVEKFYKKLKNFRQYRDLESIVGIRKRSSGIEGGTFLKICPECVKEGKLYLQREHQITGNFSCWRHKCLLKRVPCHLYDKRDYRVPLSLFKEIEQEDFSYQFTEKEKKVIYVVSEMMHEILVNGFKESIKDVKTKLCCKLLELNFLDQNGLFGDYEMNDLIQLLDVDFYYENISLRREILYAIGSHKFIDTPNPIIYLLLIYRLFGSLEGFYKYAPSNAPTLFTGGIPTDEYKYEFTKRDGVWEIKDLERVMNEKFFAEYIIVGDTEKSILLKHRICGTIYRTIKRSFLLKRCGCSFTPNNEKNS